MLFCDSSPTEPIVQQETLLPTGGDWILTKKVTAGVIENVQDTSQLLWISSILVAFYDKDISNNCYKISTSTFNVDSLKLRSTSNIVTNTTTSNGIAITTQTQFFAEIKNVNNTLSFLTTRKTTKSGAVSSTTLDTTSIRYFKQFTGTIPPAAWPQTKCQ